MESSQGPGFAIEGGGDFWIGEGEPPPLPFMWPSPQPTEPPLTSSTAPLSKPAAATTARRVFARITTPGITQRSSSTRTGTTSKRSSTGTASCQPRDARLGRRSGMTPELPTPTRASWAVRRRAGPALGRANRDLLLEPREVLSCVAEAQHVVWSTLSVGTLMSAGLVRSRKSSSSCRRRRCRRCLEAPRPR